jgi:hypothetical protein
MRLLIFLYCIARTVSHMFKTLLFFLLRPEMYRSNELHLDNSNPDYPAFLSERQGYVLFKRTIIIFIESDTQRNPFLPETVKPLALLYISLQTCVNNTGDNLS